MEDHDAIAIALGVAVADTDDLEFVGSFDTVDALLAAGPAPDVAVLDLRLADGSSPVGNADRLNRAGARVVAYTSGESPFLVRLAAHSEVYSVVRKTAPIAVLLDVVRRAANDEPVMTTEWASAIESDPMREEAGLSAQEVQVLTLFAAGLTAQSVAWRVGIAEATVEDYVRRIRSKYSRAGRPAHTKVDLYKRALEDGLLPMPDASQSTV